MARLNINLASGIPGQPAKAHAPARHRLEIGRGAPCSKRSLEREATKKPKTDWRALIG